MHCWLSALISAWIYVYLLFSVTIYLCRSLPILSNTTTVHLNDNDSTSSVKLDNNDTPVEKGFITRPNKLNETVWIYGSNTSSPDINRSHVYVSEYNTTTINSLTSTANSTNNADDSYSNPHVNLAIIPALAILVFIIIFCIRCCKWFRRYSRGSEKEEGTQYAEIVHEGDEEYGEVDIMSDTTSTAYNDTVSSYCSFLRRSGNDNTLNSFRSFKRANDNSRLSISRDRRTAMSLKTEGKLNEHSMQTTRSPEKSNADSVRASQLASADASCDARTRSASSEETEPLTGSCSDSSDAQQTNNNNNSRKSQRFKVSFVDSLDERLGDNSPKPTQRNRLTSTSEFSPKLRESLCQRSNLKRGSTASPADACFNSISNRISRSEKNTPIEEHVVFVEKRLKCGDGTTGVAPTTVSVGVQTNKSFRYKLCKSKRRCFSDPGHDPLDDKAVNKLTMCTSSNVHVKDMNEKNVSRLRNDTSQNSAACGHFDNKNPESIGYNVTETTALVHSPSDSTDDVFEMCQIPSVRYCKCSIPECNDISCMVNDKIDEVIPVGKHHDNNSPDKENTHKGTCHFTRPLLLKTLQECSDKNNGKLPICSRCKSPVVVLEGHQNFHLLVHNCDNVYHCDICKKTNSTGGKNGMIIDKRDNKENIPASVVDNETSDLIISKNSTSLGNDGSMTSLESSGYAELSSEASN